VDLFGLAVPKKFIDVDLQAGLDLVKSRPEKKKWLAISGFFESCVYQDEYLAAPVLVSTPGDVAAAVGPAVAAAVGPAVAAAVGPAVAAALVGAMATINAQFTNIRRGNRNKAGIKAVRNGAVVAGAQPLQPPLKVVAGAGPILPGGPGAGPLPMGHPFPVGTPIPSPPFPANVAALDALTLAQLDTLAVVYNEDFNVAAGDNVATRRTKFGLWMSGF